VSYAQAAQSTYHQLVETAPYVEILRQEQRRLVAEREHFGDLVPDTITSLGLEGVSYRYPSADGAPDTPALDGVDLELRRGEIVGIAGRSGSGKSTLAQVVLRLRAPTAGRVLADGVPVGDIEPRRWAELVTLVPQDVALVHGTLRDNIVFHHRGIDDTAVDAAVRAAALTEVVASLPEGLATSIGASTRDLSGGQVQRVGLARALVRDPAVLVLDEPTSALDERSEAALHQSLSELGRDRIVVVIAHRRSTLAMCDRLVVLAGGRVVRDGPRAEVLGDDLLETGLLELDRDATAGVADGG
jgi:ABC-type bacteriocin/lantibiotic exporter with double-glycine peptidase domain